MATAGKRQEQQQRASLSSLLDAVTARSAPLAALLVAVGLLGLAVLPLLERGINFDENALLAGSARPTIRSKSPGAYAAGRALALALEPARFSPAFAGELQRQLAARGLAVSNHTFVPGARARALAALRASGAAGARAAAGAGAGEAAAGGPRQRRRAARWGPGPPASCTNVHAVLSSGRGDGKEALLLVTPVNHQEQWTDFEQDGSGVSLSLALGWALLSHLGSSAPWLAKEVVWVLPDASCGAVEAMAAWTAAYQNPPPVGSAAAPPLPHFGRGGVLQQALVLEAPSGGFNAMQVGLEGHEGLLPKLDMFWLLRWYGHNYVRAPLELPSHPAGPHTPLGAALARLAGALERAAGPGAARHAAKAGTAARFAARQAAGLPSGAHAPLKALGVDAATLRLLTRDAAGRLAGPAGFLGAGPAAPRAPPGAPPPAVLGPDAALAQLGDLLELLLRSCSVLVERFHHSLFLYVLDGLDGYVSVERYIGPVAALACVLALQAAVVRSRGTARELAAAAGAGERPRNGDGLLPALPPAAAAAARAQWAAALAVVAAAHCGSIALGLLLQRAAALPWPPPGPLPPPGQLLGQLAAAAAAAAAPAGGADSAGLGCALLLGLLLSREALASALGGARSSGAAARRRAARPAVCPLKVLVVELSAAAAAMSAAACLNWALAYATCLVLVPLALGCAPPPRSAGGRARALAALLCCSPPALLLAVAVLADAGAGAPLRAAWLRSLVLGSSAGSYLAFWGAYLPAWGLCAWTTVAV